MTSGKVLSFLNKNILTKRLQLIDLLERMRVTLSMSLEDWCDFIEETPHQYQYFLNGVRDLSIITLYRISEKLNISIERIMENQVDFLALAAQWDKNPNYLPEKYLKAAFSRRWSSINFLKFVENSFGWRTRLEALRYLGVTDAIFQDPNQEISLRFVIDLLDFLGRNYASTDHFFSMGAFSVITYRNSPLGKQLRKVRDVSKIYEVLFEDLISRLLEKNCRYRVIKLRESECIVEGIETEGLAEAMGLKTLASPFLCMTKVGLTASIPGYLGLPFGTANEITCRFRGDPTCRYHVCFEEAVYLNRARLRKFESSRRVPGEVS